MRKSLKDMIESICCGAILSIGCLIRIILIIVILILGFLFDWDWWVIGLALAVLMS